MTVRTTIDHAQEKPTVSCSQIRTSLQEVLERAQRVRERKQVNEVTPGAPFRDGCP